MNDVTNKNSNVASKYRGKGLVVFYLAPYGAMTPSLKYFKPLEQKESIPGIWEAFLEERHGGVLKKYENVNPQFYKKGLEVIKGMTPEVARRTELTDLMN
jgi:hypothetical protein